MGDVRIFISHALSDETQKDAQTLAQLIQALRSAGVDVITDADNNSNTSYTQFLNQELPTCQYFILFQTPETIYSSRVQQAVDTALRLVEQQSMQEVVRFISSTSGHAIIPAAWNNINTFNATHDYQRAIEKLLRVLSSESPAVGTPKAPIISRRQISPTTPITPITPLAPTTPIAPPPPAQRVSPPPSPPSIGYDRPAVPPSKLKILAEAAQGTQARRPFWQRRKLLNILIALVVIAVLGTGLGGFFVIRAQQTTQSYGSGVSSTQANQSYGSVHFFNTGNIGPDNTTGTCDGIQIALKNLNAPATGNNYYAWLLPDKNTSNGVTTFTGTLLGKLSLNNGTASLTYIDPNNKSLLLNNSRFLITEESASTPPNSPSQNQNAWRYYAAISQTPNPKDANHYSQLDYLRLLLVKNQTMQQYYGLKGGLSAEFYRNARKVEEWASEAQLEYTGGDVSYVQRDFGYALIALDGVPNYSTYSTSYSAKQMGYNPWIPLLTLNPGSQNPPGYITDLEQNIQGLIASGDATASQRALAGQILAALSQANNELYQTHLYAKQLVPMTQEQIKSPSTVPLLEGFMLHANNAFVGRLNTTTGQRSGGITWIHDVMPQLAAFNVTPYNGNGSH